MPSKQARIDISEVLAASRKEFNSSKKNRDGVIAAFKETFFSSKKHSGLQSLLSLAQTEVYAPWGGNREFKVVCKCGFRFETEAKRAESIRKKRHTGCFYTRDKLWNPMTTGQNPSDGTAAGLLFRAEAGAKGAPISFCIL